MSRPCRMCGRRLTRPAPDGVGPVCARKLRPRPAVWPGHTQPALEDTPMTDRTPPHAPTAARAELRKYVNLLADSWTPRERTDERVEWLYSAVRAEVERARDEVIVAWLGKKAREHRARGPQYAKQADVIATMADKIRRGAARPDNLLGAPGPTAMVDLTEWADKLAADNLQPDEHELTWKAGEQPIVRVHFAFHEQLGDEARDYLVRALGEALQDELRKADQATD